MTTTRSMNGTTGTGPYKYFDEGKQPGTQVRKDPIAEARAEAARAISNDQTEAVRLQVATQMLALEQATIDGEVRNAAFLAAALDGLDTKLQVAQVNFRQDVFVESNRHTEKMVEIKLQAVEARMDRGGTDIPEPDF